MQPTTTYEDRTQLSLQTVLKDVDQKVQRTRMVKNIVMQDAVKYVTQHVTTKAWRNVPQQVVTHKTVPEVVTTISQPTVASYYPTASYYPINAVPVANSCGCATSNCSCQGMTGCGCC